MFRSPCDCRPPCAVVARRQAARLENIAGLANKPGIEALTRDVGELSDWPPAALQLHRSELHRQVTTGNRYYCIATLLTNGANPETLVDFLIRNGSIKHSEGAVTDTVNILLKHKSGDLTVTGSTGMKEPLSIVMVASGSMQRYIPDKYDEDVHLVPIREGILPGFDAHGNAAYDKVVTDLERKAKGPMLDKKPLRKRGRWDGVGGPATHQPYAFRIMPAFQPKDTKACMMTNADALGAHLIKHGGGPFWGAIYHDRAIYKLWISLGPGHRNFGKASQALKTIGKMKNYTEESRMKKAGADYEAAQFHAHQNLMHFK